MYLSKLNLEFRPFALAPDITMMVWTPGLEDVRQKITAAVAGHVPVVVLTGDVGGGKSTLILDLVDRFASAGSLQIVLLRGAIEDADDMLQTIAHQIGDRESDPRDPLERILAGVSRAPALVICDEAQATSPDAVMALAALAAETGRLTVLLSGQPELRVSLSGPAYRGLDIPAQHRHHLARLTEADARAYIATRIEKAGGDPDLIAPEAAGYIGKVAQFVPRRINKVADACLFLASLEDVSHVDVAFARRIVRDNLDPQTLALTSLSEADPAPPVPVAPVDRAVTLLPDEEPMAQTAPRQGTAAPSGLHERKTVKVKSLRASLTDDPMAMRPERRVGPKPRRAGPWAAAGLALAAVSALVFLWPAPDVDPASPETGASQQSLAPPAPTPTTQPTPEDVPPSAPRVSEPEASRDASADDAPGKLDGLEPVPTLPEPDIPVRALQADGIVGTSDPGATEFYSKALSSDDPRQAAVNYARAAIRGHARSARYLGQQFELGDGVSFSPAMAQRWYDIAEGRVPSDEPADVANASATPLLAAEGKGGLDLVWDGVGASFVVELAGADRVPVARFTSDMTAASVAADGDIAFWRVRPESGDFSPWVPVAAD